MLSNPGKADGWSMLWYVPLLISGVVMIWIGVYDDDSQLFALGVLALFVVASLYPIASSMRITQELLGQSKTQFDEILERSRMIENLLKLSDNARSFRTRTAERDALRNAIRQDIDRSDFEGALALVTHLSQAYGYHKEAEDYRDEIQNARAADVEEKVNEAIGELDELIAEHEWDQTLTMAAKIQRMYPDSPRAKALNRRIVDAREQHKHDLERQFLEAASRDDVDLAMELLMELDKYLTEAEAEPFRETARGIIGKKRDNLGVQFKLSVSDKEWTRAVRVGEQIIREFPNSKMSNEVRGMLDLLRERAAGEQAARTQQSRL